MSRLSFAGGAARVIAETTRAWVQNDDITVRLILLFLIMLLPLCAQSARYHHGDDPRWAEPQFDDSRWPAVPADMVPLPPYESSGILWIRDRVPVPAGEGPLAIRLTREEADAVPDEVWVNGVRVGSHGRFPPNPTVRTRYATVVFDLPAGLVTPGRDAVVAWRCWLPPAYSLGLPNALLAVFRFEIGAGDLLRAREQQAFAASLLANSLNPFLYVIEALMGAALLVLWFATRGSRVLLWFATFALSWGLTLLWQTAPAWGRAEWSPRVLWGGWCLGSLFLNVALNEFQFTAFSLARWPIRVVTALGIVWTLAWYEGMTAMTTSPGLWLLSRSARPLFGVWLAAIALLGVWGFLRGPVRARGLAGAFVLWGTYQMLADAMGVALPLSITAGGRFVDLENIVTLVLIGVMCGLLLRQLWGDWLVKEELHAEFDAARAMQARLVPAAADVPGFRIESAYHPARQVGGDFFRTLPAGEGAVLLVVGDVSGKGLGAAMTVAAIAGALDNEFSRRPGEVLEHLNRALLLRKGEGFVTCCAALVEPSGLVTIANAGHLAPYAGGSELAVGTDLPLGLAFGVAYEETQLAIGAQDAITFVSDGVVEAANAQGDLFGFDRMREISTKPAREIAEAAKAWGQNDDITVVTVRRVA